MSKKHIFIMIAVFILGIIIGSFVMYFITRTDATTNPNNEIITGNNNNEEEQDNTYDPLDLPTEGNNTILTTNTDTTLRVVNEYDKNFFTTKKNLLIMFASWCPNCQEEISEIEKILKHYKNVKDVNVVLIAHEYDNTVTDLIDLLENDVDFGDVEVKIDLGRVIRKTIDPEASTIPISYVVDKNGDVLEVHNESLTLEKAIEMVGK
ncbi:MAG: redoxin family protein [Clostridia bacterium]|nr:redoxin family protein [Clostridia bacterium]